MEKLRIREVVVVEGKYDATALASVVDGLILPTDGFSIFTDQEKKELLRRLGKQRGLVILTDSDAAGFRIRNYVEKVAAGCRIHHAYIPALPGKESRKAVPSKEGTLGVEGMSAEVLRKALENAGVQASAVAVQKNPLTYTDLYELGLSGRQDSAALRRALLKRLGLPTRLSKRATLLVLSGFYTRQQLQRLVCGKPVLFWDFHGTLTLPDVVWFDAAMEAAEEKLHPNPLTWEALVRCFSRTCLPWFTEKSRDTRHLTGSKAWWAHSEAHFVQMLQNCGLSLQQARQVAPALREKILQPQRYHLYPDALSTLRTLHERGYRNYILSNNFPELEEVVHGLGLGSYIQGVLSSGCIGYEKPRPEIFAAAKALLAEDEIPWMLGDNPKDDIEGAHAAQFVTVAVHGVQASCADHHIGDLSQLLGILE